MWLGRSLAPTGSRSASFSGFRRRRWITGPSPTTQTAEKVRPFHEVCRDREARKIQMDLPFQTWNDG
jgi:hypothetical protein